MTATLRFKLIAFTWGVILLVGAAIAGVSIYVVRQRILTDFEKEARENAVQIAGAVADDLYFLDVRAIRRHVENARFNPNVRAIQVADMEGVVIQDGTTENTRRGQRLADLFSQRLLRADSWVSEVQGATLRLGGAIVMPNGRRVGFLSVAFSLEGAYRGVREVTRLTLGITVACLALGGALALLFGERLSRPLRSLVEASRGIGEGKFDVALDIHRTDEVGLLAASIAEMAGNLRRTTVSKEALREQEERLRSILDTAKDAFVSIDSGSVIQDWNRQAESIFGWSRQEAIGRSLTETIIPPKFREAHQQGLRHFLATGEGPVFLQTVELPALHRAGHEFPIELTIWPVRVGETYTFNAFARDISERRQAEETRQALYQASLRIQEPLEARERLTRFLQAAQDLLRLERLNILVADPAGQWLQAVASTESEEALEAIRVPLGPAGGALAQACLSKQTIVWDGRGPVPEAYRLHPPYDRIAAIRSRCFAIVPLIVQGRAIGVLGADRKRSRQTIEPSTVDLLQLFAAQAAVALENARLYEATERAARETRELYELTTHLASSLDLEHLLDFITAKTLELLECEAAGIYLYDEARDAIVFLRGANLDPELTRNILLRPGEGIAGRAFQERRPAWTADRLADPSLQYAPGTDALIRERAPRAFLAVPIISRDKAQGVLVDYFFAPHEYTSREVELLSTLADHAAIALENARLYQETTAKEREARTLYQGLALLNQASRALHRTLEVDTMLTNALDALAEAFGADGALVNLFVEDGTFVRSVGRWMQGVRRPAGPVRPGGITRLALKTRAPVLVPDTAARPDIVNPDNVARGIKSIAAFPVVGQQDRALGVLVLYYLAPQAFPESEVRLLSSYADQLATALENAQLYEETQTHRTRLAQIFGSTSEGIILVGRHGRIESANRRAGELLGVSAESIVGLGLADVVSSHFESVADLNRTVTAFRLALLGDQNGAKEGELELPSPRRVLHWAAQPTKDASGFPVGLTLTFRDVTQEREADQMKADFVSFATHQLRTPLAGIKWMLELAAQEPGLPDEAASFIQDARASADRLIGLVNDLLDASRLERGKLAIVPQEVRLAELTQGVLDEVNLLVQEKGHRLSLTGADGLPSLVADPQLLRQVVLNLVSNAIKYTPPGGEIAIRMGRDGDAIRWSIQDSGVGIPKEAQRRLFEKFFRAENVLTIETEGTGLGLYLVRLILERFGGRVWCESEEGKGATFAFTLPLGQ
jgi:PAS domain S-box-containing protein